MLIRKDAVVYSSLLFLQLRICDVIEAQTYACVNAVHVV
jgi:hypothetical protein